MGLATVEAALSKGSTPSLTDSVFENRVTKWRRVSASRLPCCRLIAGLARSLCICRRPNAGFYHRASDLPDIQKRAPASATSGDHAQLWRACSAIGSVQLSFGTHLCGILSGDHDRHWFSRPLTNPLWVGIRCWAITGFIGRAFSGRHHCRCNNGECDHHDGRLATRPSLGRAGCAFSTGFRRQGRVTSAEPAPWLTP